MVLRDDFKYGAHGVTRPYILDWVILWAPCSCGQKLSARQGADARRPPRAGGGTEFVRALGPGVRW